MNKYMETMNNEKSETNRITMYLSRLDLSLTRSLCAMKIKTDMTHSRCELSQNPNTALYPSPSDASPNTFFRYFVHRLTSLCSNHRHSLSPPMINRIV